MEPKIIWLEKGNWKAAVMPQLGGNILILQNRGVDVLNPYPGYETWAGHPTIYGCPMLIPANLTLGGAFTYEGETYRVGEPGGRSNCYSHGILHRQEFTLISSSEEEAAVEFENHGDVYPFPFRIRVTYRLVEQEDGSVIATASYELENTGKKRMPFVFALHTTFVCPDWFQVPISERQLRPEGSFVPDGTYGPLTEEEQEYVRGCSPHDRVITGFYHMTGHSARIGKNIRFSVSDFFDHWTLFNARDLSNILSVEPQAGGVNSLVTGTADPLPEGVAPVRTIEAGETLRFSWKIEETGL